MALAARLIKWKWAAIASCVGVLVFVYPILGSAQRNFSPSKIFRDAKPSVVVIFGSDSTGQQTVQGSGFIVAQDRIVTNHHVVVGASRATAVFSDGQTSNVTGVVEDSASNDLTVLVARTGRRPALLLGDESTLQQGDTVYAIGAPEGLELTLTNGIVSAFRNINNRFLIQTTAVIGHGSSGGPLFDGEGKVVGITSALLSDTPGIYFSVGAGDLKHLLRTPQLVILPFAEWGRQNADSEATFNGRPNSEKVDQIEKLLHDKKYDEAKAAIQSLLAQAPDDEIAHRLSGELSERQGDLDVALRELARSVQQMPSDPVAQFYYALTLFEKRRFGAALEHEIRSNELLPTNSDLSFLSLLYYSTRDYAQAESFANKSLASAPNDETSLGVLAGVAYYGVSHQTDTWKQYALRISAINPDSFWAHMLRAADAYTQNQPQSGDAELIAAEKFDFPDPAPYTSLAYSYERAGKLEQADDQIKDGLGSLPNDPRLLIAGVSVALRLHDDTGAATRFATLESADPGSTQTENAGCWYYYGIGQSSKALAYCARSVEKSPDDHTSHSNYGWAENDSAQYSAALQEFLAAYKVGLAGGKQLTRVQNIDILWGTAVAKYGLGDREQAESSLQAIRELYPEAATIAGLQRLPLLWSAKSLSQIETILREVPSKSTK